VSGHVADWLLIHTDLDRLRQQHRGEDPEVDAVLIDLRRAAITWRTTTSAPASACGSALDRAPEAPTPSQGMSTGRAAKALGITSRAVRLAIAEGRLPAEQVDGRWLITAEHVETYRATRAA
jgi:excisionase family DNA binding protein